MYMETPACDSRAQAGRPGQRMALRRAERAVAAVAMLGLAGDAIVVGVVAGGVIAALRHAGAERPDRLSRSKYWQVYSDVLADLGGVGSDA